MEIMSSERKEKNLKQSENVIKNNKMKGSKDGSVLKLPALPSSLVANLDLRELGLCRFMRNLLNNRVYLAKELF